MEGSCAGGSLPPPLARPVLPAVVAAARGATDLRLKGRESTKGEHRDAESVSFLLRATWPPAPAACLHHVHSSNYDLCVQAAGQGVSAGRLSLRAWLSGPLDNCQGEQGIATPNRARIGNAANQLPERELRPVAKWRLRSGQWCSRDSGLSDESC